MNSNNAITIKGLSKTYKIFENRNYTLRGSISNLLKSQNIKTIPALKDINLEIKKGEKVGIIGRNGSGKSTLLKIIAGIYPPDKGAQIEIDGKCIRLALGTGFNQEFSARQNIYINGSLLGMTFKQIGERFHPIIDWSELNGFEDTKLKYYSSGMLTRLSFAIAMYVDADIYLIDEFFGGVGDANFKKKSDEVFDNVVMRGKTIINVCHSTAVIRESCDLVIWIDHGIIKMTGPTEKVLEAYSSSFEKK
mgnify:CR=1 FL=1